MLQKDSRKKTRKSLLSYLFLILLLTVMVSGAETEQITLGISPPKIFAEHMLPGSHFEKIIILSRDKANLESQIHVEVESQIRSWITTDKGMDFIIPINSKIVPLKIMIDVPTDTPTGIYEGKVNIRLLSAIKPKTTTTAIDIVLPIAVKVTVTDKQIIEYDLKLIRIDDIEEGSPIPISLTIDNTGNVKVSPSKIRVDIFDKFKQGTLESHEILDIDAVAPFTRSDVLVNVPNTLPSEQYWAKITVYDQDTILKKEEIIFDVLRDGTLEGKSLAELSGNSQEEQITKKPISFSGLLIATLLTMTGLAMIISYFKKRKSEK